jgi:hypothetical protein
MCAGRRFCGLLITLLFNLPIVSLVLGLDSGTWELKLFALPFAASPVAAIALLCVPRRSCLWGVAVTVLCLSLGTKLIGTVFAALGAAAAGTWNAMLGGLGVAVYTVIAVGMGLSSFSDLFLFCSEVYAPRKGSEAELVHSNDYM